MNSSGEGVSCGGGSGGETNSGGKEIDSNEKGSLDSCKQQTNFTEESVIKLNEPSEMSDPELTKKDQISEDSRNPTFVVIEQPKITKKVMIYCQYQTTCKL